MSADLQQIVVLAAIALAAAFVLWQGVARLRRRGNPACRGGCNGCGGNNPAADKGFVGLDQLTPPPSPSGSHTRPTSF